MNFRLAVAFVSLVVSGSVWAEPVCDGWPKSKEKVSGDLEANMRKLSKELYVDFEKASGPSPCGIADVWKVKDKKGQELVEIPVPKAANGADVSVEDFVARVRHARRTSITQLLALKQAEASFKKDVELLKKDWGVSVEIPKGALSEKTSDQGQEFVLQIKAPKCQSVDGGAVNNSPEIIGEMKVPALYYVPNRRRYASTEMYRDAQLRYLLLKENSDLLKKIAARADLNANQCEGAEKKSWGEYAAKLKALAPSSDASSAPAPASSEDSRSGPGDTQ